MPRAGKRKTTPSETAEDIRSPKKRFVESDNMDRDVETKEDSEQRDNEQAGESVLSPSSEPPSMSGETPAPSKAQERMDRFKALQARAVSTSIITAPNFIFSNGGSLTAKRINIATEKCK
jgi:hypothetical protein